jgi:exonuclease III
MYYKLVTLNINGIVNRTQLWMLWEFLVKHAVDIALLQEVTSPQVGEIQGYTSYLNIGMDS